MAPWFQNWHPYVRPFAIHCKCLLAHSDVISQKKWGELGHDGWCIYQGRAVDWSSGTLTSTPTQASKNQFRLRLRAELSIDSDSDSAAMTSLRSRWILVTPTPSLAPDSKIDFISTLTPVRTSGVNRNLNLRNSDFVQCPIRNSVGQWQQALDNFGQSLATPQHFYKVIVFNIDWLLESSAFDMNATFELVTIH